MPDCHSCPNNGTQSLACIACPGPSDEPNHHGKNHVSIDQVSNLVYKSEVKVSNPDFRVDIDHLTTDKLRETLTHSQGVQEEGFDYAASISFIRALCGMGTINREIVFSRIMGIGYESLAKNINSIVAKKMTFQAIHGRVKRLLSDPAVNELFREMVTKRNRRCDTGNGNKTVHGTQGATINLERLPGLLASKAEALDRVKALKDSFKGGVHSDGKALKKERALISRLEKDIVRCWKFPYRKG